MLGARERDIVTKGKREGDAYLQGSSSVSKICGFSVFVGMATLSWRANDLLVETLKLLRLLSNSRTSACVQRAVSQVQQYLVDCAG